ncbi:unnamed protein product [Symbiodinium microadriaticum]|nr:unnamed protein product [Symbiodinium microadriaticum]
MASSWFVCMAYCWLWLALPEVDGALTVGPHHTDDLLRKLRSSIFVETSFLEERPAEAKCSSLDGPQCFFAVDGAGLSLDGPGVIPERLLHDLGVDGPGLDFMTPEYMILEAHVRQGSLVQELSHEPPLLGGAAARDFLAHGRNATETGLLHFTGAQLDHRLPVTFSQGLPGNVVATFDGRWIARDCHSAGRAVAGLPQSAADGALAFPSQNAVGFPSPEDAHEQQLSVSAELAGSIGYLRFSRPVSVRSLFARWAPGPGAPKALIGGRLGLQHVWTSHLDPQRLHNDRGWVDVGGGPLDQVDELVFVAAQGLHLGAIGIAHIGEGEDNAANEERAIMVLRPVTAEEEDRPRFALMLQRLRPDAAPFMASLQEVVDLNLRLRLTPPARALGGARGEQVEGVLAADTMLSIDNGTALDVFHVAASQHAALFSHQGLNEMGVVLQWLLAGIRDMPGHPAPLQGFLPADLRRQLTEEGGAAATEAIDEFVNHGGWKRSTPTALPRNGTEDAVHKYIVAKKQQLQLDLITTAMIYVHRT